MIEYNIRTLKPNEQVQKNVLYEIKGDMCISVQEAHGESQDSERVNLEYHLKEGQYAIFAYEYRPSYISKQGCKSADVMTCLIDDDNKDINSLIFDIKRNISAFSDNLLKEGALITAVKEVKDFIDQIHHTMLHKEGILLYRKEKGYTERAEVGIVTRRFECEKFLQAAEFLENLTSLPKPAGMQPSLWYKFQYNLSPYVNESQKLREFADCKVTVSKKQYPLRVYLLKKGNGLEYAVSVQLKFS